MVSRVYVLRTYTRDIKQCQVLSKKFELIRTLKRGQRCATMRPKDAL